jgi:hypothetical protein
MIVLYPFLNNFQALLSRKELFEISGEISKRFAPVKPVKTTELLEKSKPTQQELLEISQNISRYYAPRISSNSQKLVVLSIDPQHLYVYWSLDENRDYTLSRSILNKEMVLRVYSQLKGKQPPTSANPLVEIAINDFHSRQKIYIPAPETPTVYSASIGQTIAGDGFVSLIDSNITHAVQGTEEQNINIKKQDNVVDYKNAGFIDVGVLYERPGSVKSHFASTNNSGKGKR